MLFKKGTTVYGAGGKDGGGGGGSTYEDANTLKANMYARFQAIVCEGEIEGLVDGMSSVYLDGTPVASSNTRHAVGTFRLTTGSAQAVLVTPSGNEGISFMDGLVSWMTVSGTGVPANTFIASLSLPDGGMGIYMSNTATATGEYELTLDSTTEYNFRDFIFHLRTGTQDQGYIPGLENIESQLPAIPTTNLLPGVPVVFTINDKECSAFRLSMYTPQMTNQVISNGNVYLHGSSAVYSVEIKSAADTAYKLIGERGIYGKCVSTYVTSERFDLPSGTGPWQIKVTRWSPLPASSAETNNIGIHSVFALYDLKLRYPNTAMFGGQVSAAQFASVPSIRLFLKLLKVWVPANYDPIARTYATTGPGTTNGVWDGTFKIAWTDNPAWCFYDLVMNKRYGLGKYLRTSALDKYFLYDIAQYCDELVPDGYGGMEPRFTCNLVLTDKQEALRVISSFASVFRAMTFWANGRLNLSPDRTQPSVALFNPTSVENGVFTYSGATERARHTVAIVGWNNHANLSQIEYEYVPDDDGIRDYGINETEVYAMGCASRGQARRVGRYILFTELFESTICSFSVPLNGALALPGHIIDIMDPFRYGTKRLAGRVKSATVNTIELDAPVEVDSTKTYSIVVTNSSGQLFTRPLVIGASGTYSTFTYAIPLPASDVPPPNAVWAMGEGDKLPLKYRVLDIEENGNGTYKITAMRHYPEKTAWIEQEIPFDTTSVPLLPYAGYVAPASNVVAVIETNQNSSTLDRKIFASWTASNDKYFSKYKVSYRIGTGTWTELPSVTNARVTFPVTGTGFYTVRVVTENANGRTSNPTYGSIQVNSAYTTPGVVSGLSLLDRTGNVFVGSDAVVKWAYTRDGVADPYPLVDSFKVRVYDIRNAVSPVLLRVVDRTDLFYRYSYDDNFKDTNGSPSRALRFTVSAVEKDRLYAETANATFDVSNSLPLLGANPPTHDGSKFIMFTLGSTLHIQLNPPPSDPDFGGTMVFVSTNSAFARSDVVDAQGNIKAAALVPYDYASNTGMLLYQGWDASAVLALKPSTTYYFVYAPFDGFGKQGLNYYGPFSISTDNSSVAQNGIVFRLSNNAALIPTDSAGNGGIYTYATTGLAVYDGVNDATANWTLSATPSGGVTGSLVGANYSVTNMTTDTGYVDFTATRSGYATQNARMSLSKAKSGASLTSYYVTSKGSVVKKVAGVYTNISFAAYTWTGTSTPTPYAGRIKIEASSDGTNYSTVYTSAAPESAGAHTPTGTVVRLRMTLYLSSDTGLTTPIDQQFVYVVEDGAAGTPGTAAVSGLLTNDSVSLAADNAGTVASFASATGTFKVFNGTTDVTTSSAFSVTGQTGCTGTVNATTGVYSVSAMSADNATLTLQAVYAGTTITKTFALAKSKTGTTGANGQRSALLTVYQWAANAPAAPSGTSTHTWATNTWTLPSTPGSWVLTPGAGSAGLNLYEASVRVSNTNVTATDTVTWTGVTVAAIGGFGTNGTNGSNGQRVAVVSVYQWAASAPTAPSGTSTYTWATGATTLPATPGSWSLTIGAPVVGQNLYEAYVLLSNANTSATDTVTWSGVTVAPISYAGTNGTNAQYVVITGEQAFKFPANSTAPTNTTITLTAALFGGLSTYNWQYWNGSAWADLGGTSSTFALAYNNAAFTGASLRVRCLSGSVFDEITIAKVYDGAFYAANLLDNSNALIDTAGWLSGYNTTTLAATLTRKTQADSLALAGEGTFACTVTGTPAVSTTWQIISPRVPVVVGKAYQVSAYVGALGISTGQITIAWYNSSDVYLSQNTSSQIAVGAGGVLLTDFTRLYSYGVAPANAVYARLAVNAYANGTQSNPALYMTRALLAEALTGQTAASDWTPRSSAGANAISGYLTNDSIALAADNAGVVASFSNATGTFKVFNGALDVTASATFSVTGQNSCTGTIGAATGIYSVTAMSADNATLVVQAVYNGVTLSKTFTLTKSKTGTAGTNGTNGQRTALLTVYQWASSAPTAPSGTSTYTWATNSWTLPTTPGSWVLTPGAGSAGLNLYEASVRVSNTSVTATDTVTWTGVTVAAIGGFGANGTNGSNGQRVAVVSVYQWSASAPTAPSGTSTYTWATGATTLPSTPGSWVLTPGAPVVGQNLYEAYVVLSNNSVAATDTVTWSGVSVAPIGYAGTNGTNGNNGQRVAKVCVYQWATTAPTAPSGTSTYTWSTASTTLPTTPGSWVLTPGVPPAVGYRLYEASVMLSNASTGSTDTVTWSGVTLAVIGYSGANGNNGADSVSYWTISTAASLSKSVTNVFTPSTVTFTSMSKTGSGTPAAYAGRFIIAETTDGSAYTDKYTSAANESSKVYTPSATNIKAIRCRLYLAGGTTTLIDETVIVVVNDGATGTTGTRGNVKLSYSIGTGTAWSDTSAATAITSAGLTLMANDEVTLYNDTNTFAQTKKYNGASWVAVGTYIDGSLIVQNSVSAASLAAITAWTKQLTIGTNGYFSCGQTAYNTGIGWWMDYNAGSPRFSLGNPAGNYLAFNGTALDINANAITLANATFTRSLVNSTYRSSLKYGNLSYSGYTPVTLEVESQITDASNGYEYGELELVGKHMSGGATNNSRALYSSNGIYLSYTPSGGSLGTYSIYDNGLGDAMHVLDGIPTLQLKTNYSTSYVPFRVFGQASSAGTLTLGYNAGSRTSTISTSATNTTFTDSLGFSFSGGAVSFSNNVSSGGTGTFTTTLTVGGIASGNGTLRVGYNNGARYGTIVTDANATTIYDATLVKFTSPKTQVMDRLNLWASGASWVRLDIQNTLAITTSDAANNLIFIDEGNTKIANGFRVQNGAATQNVSRAITSHKITSGWNAPAVATSFNITIDISALAFTATPKWGMAQALDDITYSVTYRDDQSTSSSAVFQVKKRSGGNFAVGETVWAKLFLEHFD